MVRTLTADQFLQLAVEVSRLWPEAELARTVTGNLNVVSDGVFVAWIDLRAGQLNVADAFDRSGDAHRSAL